MKSASVLCGDRLVFAIECHIESETDSPAKNPVGSLWFWIGGEEVGNRDVISLPGIVANELRQTLHWCGQRNDLDLFSASASTVLDNVDSGLYASPGSSSDDVQKWARFLICMLPGGHEYMDGWLTVMIESPEGATSSDDRVLYRGAGLRQDREVWLPRGAYRAAVQEFLEWYDGVNSGRELR